MRTSRQEVHIFNHRIRNQLLLLLFILPLIAEPVQAKYAGGHLCNGHYECESNHCVNRRCAKGKGMTCSGNYECISSNCLGETRTCGYRKGTRGIGESCEASTECGTGNCLSETQTCGYKDRTRDLGASCQSHTECKSDDCLPDKNICGIRIITGGLRTPFYKLGFLSAVLFAIFLIFRICAKSSVATRQSLITGETVTYN